MCPRLLSGKVVLILIHINDAVGQRWLPLLPLAPRCVSCKVLVSVMGEMTVLVFHFNLRLLPRKSEHFLSFPFCKKSSKILPLKSLPPFLPSFLLVFFYKFGSECLTQVRWRCSEANSIKGRALPPWPSPSPALCKCLQTQTCRINTLVFFKTSMER